MRLPLAAIPRLQEAMYFHVYDPEAGVCRWMTSWDTSEEDVDRFAEAVRVSLAG